MIARANGDGTDGRPGAPGEPPVPPASPTDPAIVALDLTRRYGDFTAVDALSFEVATGEIFGFLGPNGAGKTTAIRMLTGLLPPTSGSASVAGHDVATDASAVRRSIGYMSQLFSLYGDLTVEENLELYSGLYDLEGSRRRERIEWALSMAELADRRDQMTGELPLGLKQRLALGSAVLHQPPVLFLDEPTSGVDPVARRAFWEMIRRMAEGGTTVLVTTHYMAEAERCGRVLLMNRGKRIALDSPARLKADLSTPILEVRTGDPARAAVALSELPGVEDATLFGRTVHVVAEEEAPVRERIAARLAEEGIECRAIERVPPSLEDVFVALVRRAGGVVAG